MLTRGMCVSAFAVKGTDQRSWNRLLCWVVTSSLIRSVKRTEKGSLPIPRFEWDCIQTFHQPTFFSCLGWLLCAGRHWGKTLYLQTTWSSRGCERWLKSVFSAEIQNHVLWRRSGLGWGGGGGGVSRARFPFVFSLSPTQKTLERLSYWKRTNTYYHDKLIRIACFKDQCSGGWRQGRSTIQFPFITVLLVSPGSTGGGRSSGRTVQEETLGGDSPSAGDYQPAAQADTSARARHYTIFVQTAKLVQTIILIVPINKFESGCTYDQGEWVRGVGVGEGRGGTKFTEKVNLKSLFWKQTTSTLILICGIVHAQMATVATYCQSTPQGVKRVLLSKYPGYEDPRVL